MWKSWRTHFEETARRPLPMARAPELNARARARLVATLAQFQLGETSEGRLAHQVDRARLPAVDDDYRAALKLFIREEGRHAAILAGMVKALGGSLLQRSWAERLFRHGRRLVGVRFKLLVLLAGEIVAIAFYGALVAALPAGSMRDAFEEIVGDEDHHLAFHCQFFARQPARWLVRAAWWPLALATSAFVLLNHFRTLRALEISVSSVAGRLLRAAVRCDRGFTSQPAPVSGWHDPAPPARVPVPAALRLSEGVR